MSSVGKLLRTIGAIVGTSACIQQREYYLAAHEVSSHKLS